MNFATNSRSLQRSSQPLTEKQSEEIDRESPGRRKFDFCRRTPIVDDDFFSTVPGLNFDMYMTFTRIIKTHHIKTYHI